MEATTKISHPVYDLSQKSIVNFFQDKALSFFGFQSSKIEESLNVELVDIKMQGKRTDLVFLLEDGSILHLEFQTHYQHDDLLRFINYDILVHQQHKRRQVKTLIIYSAGVKRREVKLDFHTLVYKPYVIFLEEKDGDHILSTLEQKLQRKERFNDEDLLNLLFNYFMGSRERKADKAKRLIEVANAIEEDEVRQLATVSMYSIASKFLDRVQLQKLDEVIKMTDPLVELVQSEAAKVAPKMAEELALKLAPKLAEGMAEEMAEEMVEAKVAKVFKAIEARDKNWANELRLLV
ncbi:MAG: hypothetical protein FWG67_06950 [Defluviitaleaceae bacterium]|nr:hypothetical protein [Defluviitaleaceae bacterium]